MLAWGLNEEGSDGTTYSTDDVIVIGQVSLATLATVDALAVQIDVVCQTHVAIRWAATRFEPYLEV